VISILAIAVLAASPVRLEEVREHSRRSTRALQAELDRQRAVEQVGAVRGALLPQVSLSGVLERRRGSPGGAGVLHVDPGSGAARVASASSAG